MYLTKRGEYALRTLIRLGVAQRLGVAVMSVSRLAETERISAKFLENIIADLKGGGYLESVRGKAGGARLIANMDSLRMGELVRFMDGRLAPIGCASETDYEPCSCPDAQHCGLRMLMIDVRNAISNILDKYTLGDVVTVTMRKIERDGLALQAVVGAKPQKPREARRTRPQASPKYADPKDGFLAGLLGELKRQGGAKNRP